VNVNQAEKAKLFAEEETERARIAQDLAERLAYKGAVQTVLTKTEAKNYTGMREILFGTEIIVEAGSGDIWLIVARFLILNIKVQVV